MEPSCSKDIFIKSTSPNISLNEGGVLVIQEHFNYTEACKEQVLNSEEYDADSEASMMPTDKGLERDEASKGEDTDVEGSVLDSDDDCVEEPDQESNSKVHNLKKNEVDNDAHGRNEVDEDPDVVLIEDDDDQENKMDNENDIVVIDDDDDDDNENDEDESSEEDDDDEDDEDKDIEMLQNNEGEDFIHNIDNESNIESDASTVVLFRVNNNPADFADNKSNEPSEASGSNSSSQAELSLPGCSKDEEYVNSNVTIRNMCRSRPSSSSCPEFRVFRSLYDEEEEDERDLNCQCICLSSHEDEDDDEELDEQEWSRIWRKRKNDGASTPTPPQCKRYCSAGSVVPSSSTNTTIGTHQYQPNTKQWVNIFASYTNFDKIYALNELVNWCTASHIRHMITIMEPLLKRDFISLLPKELALTVLGFLRPKDLLVAAQTCRYWRFLADDNLLWKEQCRRIGITVLRKKTRYIPRCANPWKAAYMKNYLIENNWVHKSVENPMILHAHDEHVITCLQFYGSRILSGSDDTTLKLWSAVTGKCIRTLVGHAGGVWSSQMVGHLIVSGSTDRTLRVWNADSGRCLNVLQGHTSTVRCLHLHKDKVVSGSRDATLRIWSIKDGRCLRILIGHLAAVRCVQYDGKVVVSGAYDFYVKVWNPETGECIHTLAGHTNRVYSLQFDGVHVVSGSLDTSIKVWDVETGQLKHTLVGHQSLTSGMELHSNILVSGNADSTVKIWDITTGRCLHTLAGPNKHRSAVTCLQSNSRFVVSSSDDGTVKLWDMRTGEFIRNLVQLDSGRSGGVVWRIRTSETKLVCALGSRNGTESTKLMVLDFDEPSVCKKCED